MLLFLDALRACYGLAVVSFFFYKYNLSCFVAPWLLWLAFYGCFSSCSLVARLWAPDFSPEKRKALSFAFGFSASCGSGSLLVSGALCLVGCGRPLALLSLRSGSVLALRV